MRPLAFEFRRFDSGELLHRIPLGAQHEQAHGAPYFQIHRADLHRALQAAVQRLSPGCVTLNARATHIEDCPVACRWSSTAHPRCRPSCWSAPTASSHFAKLDALEEAHYRPAPRAPPAAAA